MIWYTKFFVLVLWLFGSTELCASSLGRPRTLGLSQSLNIMGLFFNRMRPKSLGHSRDDGIVLKTKNPNTIGVISQSQKPKILGQSQGFGTVPEARDSPGTFGLSYDPESQHHGVIYRPQKPGRFPRLWDSPRRLGCWNCAKDPESQHNEVYFSISETVAGRPQHS